MNRLPDWSRRLDAFMDAHMGRTFAWGSQDCCTFAADNVLALLGADPLADLRGRWKTELGAARVLARVGGYVRAVTERIGPATGAQFARRGDLVLFPEALTVGRWPGALGVCFGAKCGVPGADRLGFRPIGDATICWPVGVA